VWFFSVVSSEHVKAALALTVDRFALAYGAVGAYAINLWGVYASNNCKHGYRKTLGGLSRSYLASMSGRNWHLLLVGSRWRTAPALLR
jgi:hypothetical protein